MTDSTRKPRKPIQPVTVEETQAALDALVREMGADRVSPAYSVKGSASGLLAKEFGIESSRASYILYLLDKDDAITRIGNSYRFRINRKTVRLENPPVLPDTDRELYEAAIRRLSELLDQQVAFSAGLSTKVDELMAMLDELTKPDELTKTDGPSSDVLEIMAGIGVA